MGIGEAGPLAKQGGCEGMLEHGCSSLEPSVSGGQMVARDRIELSTYRFSGGRSYQLSYLAVLDSPPPVAPRN
jgi:hypothetical protein